MVDAQRQLPEIPLVIWGGLLNGAWEFLHSPFYADHKLGAWHIVWTRLHCTIGDLMILLASFWMTSLIFRTRQWVRKPQRLPAAVFQTLGLSYTTYSEWYNTSVARAWQYAPAMPTVWGIGIYPLLQWLVIPPLVLYLVHRQLLTTPQPEAEQALREKV